MENTNNVTAKIDSLEKEMDTAFNSAESAIESEKDSVYSQEPDCDIEDLFIEPSLKKVKTRSELRPDIVVALRNLFNQVEVIKYSQAVAFCVRQFGMNAYAASKTIDEIARARNLYVDKINGTVSLYNYKSHDKLFLKNAQSQILSFWTFLDFLPNASDIVSHSSPFVHSYFVKDMFIETAVFNYGEETLLFDKIKYQHSPKLTAEEATKRRRIAIIDNFSNRITDVIHGCGFTHICRVDGTGGHISIIKQYSPEDAWEVKHD